MGRPEADEENVFYKNLLAPQIVDQSDKYFAAMLKANDAQALMLLEQGILNKEEAGKLLQLSRELAAQGASKLAFTPDKEDLYLNIEAILIDRLGDYVGGKLHTGRSRNDLYAAVQRLKCRDTVLEIAQALLDLRTTLLRVAGENLTTVIPGYTHMQPAQPITYGYYLAALGHAFERDFDRLAEAYRRTNHNPLGACALAGTGFPIDRTAVGNDLGFEGDVENALDAVAARDYVADIVFAMTMALSDLGRMHQDFYFWVTSEFSTLSLPDEFVIGSSIMPQKRNPIVFEHSLAKVSHLLGALVSVVTTMKGLPYTHSRGTSGEVFALLWGSFAEAKKSITLTTAVLGKMKINQDIALRNTRRNFSASTELAEEIVRKMDVSFRTAYRIVKQAVFPLYRLGKTSEDLSLAVLNKAALEVLKRPLEGITEADVERALSPLGNLEARTVPGGPTPTMVAKDIAAMAGHLADHARQLQAWKARIETADRGMQHRIAQLIGGLPASIDRQTELP